MVMTHAYYHMTIYDRVLYSTSHQVLHRQETKQDAILVQRKPPGARVRVVMLSRTKPGIETHVLLPEIWNNVCINS